MMKRELEILAASLGAVSLLIVGSGTLDARVRPVRVDSHQSASREAEVVAVALRVRGERPDLARVTMHVAPSGGDGPAPRELVVPMEGRVGRASLKLATGRDWRIEALADGYRSPVKVVSPGSASAVEITLWPTAPVAARLKLPRGHEAPSQLDVRLHPVPTGEASAETAGPSVEGLHLTCAVSEAAIDACPLPVGRWNVRVDAEGFTPVYRWDATVQPDRGGDLGTIPLRKGGSVFGRVVTPGGPPDPETATVELRPMLDPGVIPEADRERLGQLARSTEPTPWGRFQFVGVAPGDYEVTVEQPGFSPATRSPVTVERGALTEVDPPLSLEPPLRLALTIAPAEDPFGNPWTVRLHRPTGAEMMEQVAEGSTDPSGAWTSPGLPKGEYEVQVLDDGGDSLLWREVVLSPSSRDIHVELPLVFAEGSVALGDEPLAADLYFGGRAGEESVETESDDEGEFLVILPRGGTWSVDVFSEEPPIKSRGLEVEVEPVEGLRWAEVRIELPDTSVEGEVVDETGAPVPAARVRLHSLGEWKGVEWTTTDDEGRFEVQGLQPGTVAVEASAGDRRSQPVMLSVQEDQTRFARLTLFASRPMGGRVVSEAGPVPGARVLAYPVGPDGRLATMRVAETRSRADGSFQLRVPGNSTQVRLLVMAPGHALHVRRVREGDSLRLVLTRAAGTLQLGSGEEAEGDSGVGLVLVDGAPVDLPRLRTWARMHGVDVPGDSGLTVPAMPPGRYAYCRLGVREALLVLAGWAAPSGEACSAGHLVEGAELVLSR